MKIHCVPIYGKVPVKFQNTLKKIEQVTEADIWNGITGVYISDANFSLANGIDVGGYTFANNPATPHVNVECVLTFADNTNQNFLCQTPFIRLITGSFPDEYWFVQNLLHEVGHHNEPVGLEYKDQEIRAHRFSLKYLQHFQKTEELKPHPRFWPEAEALGPLE